MNPVLTNAGRAYIADRDANDLPVVLDEFRLGDPEVGGGAPSDPDPAMTAQTSVVWSGPPTAEGLLAADSVVYSLLIGTNVGDFDITQIGLWSDTGVLVYLANIPTYHKRASGPAQLGNNFIFNANILYAGIAALAEMQAAAETWQQDFTALLALKENKAEKGAANGYPGLNAAQKVVQEPASKGQPNGIASLDGATRLTPAQTPRGTRVPEIVVGNAADVAAFEATHTIATFAAAVANGDRIRFLASAGPFGANVDLTGDDIELETEPEAVLDFATFTLTCSGQRVKGWLRVSNAGPGDIVLSGAGTMLEIEGASASAFTLSNGASVRKLGNTVSIVLSDAAQTVVVPPGGARYVINPSAARILTIDASQLDEADPVEFLNLSASFKITLKSSDGDTICSYRNGWLRICGKQAGPTDGSHWKLLEGSGGAKPSFAVHKNGSDQAVSTTAATLVTFGAEENDTNDDFASDVFTCSIPGIYEFAAAIGITAGTDQGRLQVTIDKNSAQDRGTTTRISGTEDAASFTRICSVGVGTNVFVSVRCQDDGTYSVKGSNWVTNFSGCLLAYL